MPDDKNYMLIAVNAQGASVTFCGNTQKEVIDDFDREYARKGFKIKISLPNGQMKTIKKTHR